MGFSWDSGVVLGSFFAVSRSMLVLLSPKEKLGEHFGLYNLFERFASVIAPLIFSFSVLLFGFLGTSGSYRASGLIISSLLDSFCFHAYCLKYS